MATSKAENDLLKLLAVAIANNPRSTTKELAEASGISKATLHRFCGTRENLETMLVARANNALNEIILTAEKDFPDYKIGLKELISKHYKEHELLRLVFTMQSCSDEQQWIPYTKAIDSFFLKGQKQGAFRIDFSVGFLSEIFVSSLCGLIDAEHRGRVAKVGMADAFEDFFLCGAQKN